MTRHAAPRLLTAILTVLLAGSACLGCAAESERSAAQQGHAQDAPLSKGEAGEGAKDVAADDVTASDPGTGSADAPVGPQRVCAGLAQRNCVVEIVQASGVRSCWKGVQFCVDGAWTECFEADDASTLPN